FDTSGCTAPICSRARLANVSMRNDGIPGDDRVSINLEGLDGSGRTFDPTTEGVNITVRDDTRITDATVTASQLYYQGTVPAGPPWTATPNRYLHRDKGAPTDHVAKIDLPTTSGFGGNFNAAIRVRATALPAGTLNAQVATVVVRIGDDCWTATPPCSTH